jgi:hypothetical protein
MVMVHRTKKKWFFAVVFGLGILLMIMKLPSHAQKTPKTLTILYSNNINGEIEPCPT